MSDTVAIVDLYGPTARLAEAFTARGFAVVRVQSTAEVPPVYRPVFDPTRFAVNIIHRGDLDETAAQVQAHRPRAVITGGELGIELADALSEHLGLDTNGSNLSAARRHKYLMVEQLRAAGLRATDQLLVESAAQLRDWHADRGGRVVVKPVRSMANDGVSFCDTPDESVTAYLELMSSANIFGIPHEGVVAQAFLVGAEFVVNSVSCRGQHRFTDLWQYTKMSANGVSDRVSGAVSVPVDDPAWAVLTDYAGDVLTALGVDYGPAHLEVMLTPDGPTMVEIGVRLCGADTSYFAEIAGGESQIEWTVDAFTDPDRFLDNLGQSHQTSAHVAMAFLTSPVAGTLTSYPLLPEVESLPSFHNVQLMVRPGEELEVTVSDITEPAMVGLAHPVREVLRRDLNTVNYLDGHGFYEVAGR